MGKIRMDQVILSSANAGFGYIRTISGSITISGSVPDGGKNFLTTIVVPSDSFIIGYYRNPDSTDVPALTNKRLRIGNLSYAVVDSPNTSTIKENKTGAAYTVTVFFGNLSGSAVVAKLQNISIEIYVFSRPFS